MLPGRTWVLHAPEDLLVYEYDATIENLDGAVHASQDTSILLAGGFLAIGSCISAVTKSQVIAFVISIVVCFLFYVSGFPMVLNFFTGWAPQALVSGVAALSTLTHFDSIQKGIIDIRDLIYFAVLISFWLYANVITIEAKKAG